MNIGSYKVLRQIGEGGFGRTYEAKHILLEERACLKQNSNLTKNDSELLRKETKLMWDINHHSLPVMRDFFKAPDGSYVLAMQFIDGRELQKTIEKHESLETETICWITQRLLNALYYLHSFGVIHGDVKPGNIIVQPNNHNAVLVDYGLSSVKPKRDTTAAGYTALFAAPEVVDGKPPIPESDMYSLGVTMLYALGGNPVSKTFPDIVPDKLQAYFSNMMRYNPLDRPDVEKDDLVKRLSNLRQELFGRRHTL